jgi:serine/threonine protein kinase
MFRVSPDLEKYVIDSKNIIINDPITQGEFYDIYTATLNNKQVAIKRLNHLMKLKSWGNKSFLQEEALTIAKLQSPNIVKLIGVTTDEDGYLSIVMKLYKSNLKSFLNEKKIISFEQKVRLAKDISEGLDYIHKNGYLHGDLSGKNIFLTEKNRAKIGDFGLTSIQARLADVNEEFAGTFNYWAPEVANNSPLTIASEVFSLGSIIWQLVTKHVPFASLFPEPMLECIRNYQYEPIPKNCPLLFRVLISACWHKDPEERPTTQWISDQCNSVLSSIHSVPKIAGLIKNAENNYQLHPLFSFLDKYIIPYDERFTPAKNSVRIEEDCFGVWIELLDNKKVSIKARNQLDLTSFYEAYILDQLILSPYPLKLIGLCIETLSDGVTGIWIIMESFKDTLSAYLKKSLEKPEIINDKKKLEWCRDICYGLQYIHNAGFIHAALTPKSIFIDNDDKVKIGRLDYALPQQSHFEQKSSKDEKIIPIEAWPVAWLSADRTTAHDIFMLGNVFWEMALYSSSEFTESIYHKNPLLKNQHTWQSKPIPEDSSFLFKILILACWNKDPSARPSPKHIGDLFNAALKDLCASQKIASLESKSILHPKFAFDLKSPLQHAKPSFFSSVRDKEFLQKTTLKRSVSATSFFCTEKNSKIKAISKRMDIIIYPTVSNPIGSKSI